MIHPSSYPFLSGIALLIGAVSAPAAIIVDGINRGNSYTLTSNASSIFLTAANDLLQIRGNINGNLTLDAVADSEVRFTQGNVSGSFDFTGGDLQIAGNANISGGLDVQNGNVDIQGGNISGGIDLFAGIVTLNAQPNININGDINASGGGFFADRTSNLSGNLNFSGTAVGFFGNDARNINGRLIVSNDAAIYMANSRTASTGADATGRILGSTGRITGLGSNINFSTTSQRNIFLGAARSDILAALAPAAVPEPARTLTALFGFATALFARRRK